MEKERKYQQSYVTPCYEINLEQFHENCDAVMQPFEKAWDGNVAYGYSVKTNHHEALMRYAADHLGWYIETVSVNEYEQVRQLVPAERIIFNGPCKQERLLTVYEQGGILNLDNPTEVERLCEAVRNGAVPSEHTQVGLRINFDLEAQCPDETTAGTEVSRFGICYENGDLKRAIDQLGEAGIAIDGIHLHTSTKTRSTRVFAALAGMAVKIREEYGLSLSYVDMGGGYFGGQKVTGKPTMEEYAACICGELRKGFSPEKTTLILEPGASVIATCVNYISRVIGTRDVRGVRAVTLDGSLLHINPFMSSRIPSYEWLGDGDRQMEEVQIVSGCTCMENDRFLKLIEKKRIETGDVFVFHYAGAYTMAFNSEFILQPPRVYVVNEDR